jgi:phosphate transport system ATP-binding protein
MKTLWSDISRISSPDASPVAVRRRIGMVFQKPNPFPKSIYDNVAFGLRINGERDRGTLDEIVERACTGGGRYRGRQAGAHRGTVVGPPDA